MNMTLNQFAAIHDLSSLTVSNYLRQGQISGIKISGAWIITVEESERYAVEGLRPKE